MNINQCFNCGLYTIHNTCPRCDENLIKLCNKCIEKNRDVLKNFDGPFVLCTECIDKLPNTTKKTLLTPQKHVSVSCIKK